MQIFLQEESLELMERNVVRTRLVLDGNKNLIGFYSLFNNVVKINKSKREELNVFLPHEVKEIPAIRLHYLGVDNNYMKQGYGSFLMSSVLYNCAKVAQMSGCSLITVESTKSAEGFYAKHGFMHIRSEGKFDMMGMNTKGLIELLDS
ncbi:GNAT family N-acetyltransferase [Lentibacillus sp. L22]